VNKVTLTKLVLACFKTRKHCCLVVGCAAKALLCEQSAVQFAVNFHLPKCNISMNKALHFNVKLDMMVLQE